jgi:hypothetical protein
MPLTALVLALASAVASAVWNLLLKLADDTEAASAVAIVLGVILFAPALRRPGPSSPRPPCSSSPTSRCWPPPTGGPS